MKVTQSCPILCESMNYTVHGILQARILEWRTFPFSRGSSQPRDWTQVSHTAGRFFTSWAKGKNESKTEPDLNKIEKTKWIEANSSNKVKTVHVRRFNSYEAGRKSSWWKIKKGNGYKVGWMLLYMLRSVLLSVNVKYRETRNRGRGEVR